MNAEKFDLTIDRDGLRGLLAPFVVEAMPVADPRWQARVAGLRARWRKRLLKRRLLGWLPDVRRTQDYVKRSYTKTWSDMAWPDLSPEALDPKPTVVEWRNEGLVVRRHGLARVTMYMQARALQQIAPANVLEVGAGFGVKLFSLASMIGNGRFTGIELTESGVARAHEMQAEAELPADMVRYLPLPLADAHAFKRAEMRQVDAQALPFAADSFDVVYTHRALEQMDMIRERAMAEIARVTRRYAVFIEPFAEFNTDPLARSYLNAKDYFRMPLTDLPRFGLEVVHRDADLPQKIVNRVGLVVARKR